MTPPKSEQPSPSPFDQYLEASQARYVGIIAKEATRYIQGSNPEGYHNVLARIQEEVFKDYAAQWVCDSRALDTMFGSEIAVSTSSGAFDVYVGMFPDATAQKEPLGRRGLASGSKWKPIQVPDFMFYESSSDLVDLNSLLGVVHAYPRYARGKINTAIISAQMVRNDDNEGAHHFYHTDVVFILPEDKQFDGYAPVIEKKVVKYNGEDGDSCEDICRVLRAPVSIEDIEKASVDLASTAFSDVNWGDHLVAQTNSQ